MSPTSMPTSSSSSRATHSSSDSPGSTKPASTLYMVPGKRCARASRISSPRVTRTITAGERRGKAAWPHTGQRRGRPPPAGAGGGAPRAPGGGGGAPSPPAAPRAGRGPRGAAARAAAVEMRAIPLDQLSRTAGERPEVLVDAAVEIAQGAEGHAFRWRRPIRQLGGAARNAVQFPEVQGAKGHDAERGTLVGGRQLVVVAGVADEHVHAPDADPQAIAGHDGHGAGYEPRAHASAQSVNHAARRPASSPSGCASVTTGNRVRTSSSSPASAGGGSRSASDIACDEIAATIAIAASRQRPPCSWRRQAKKDGAHVSFWPYPPSGISVGCAAARASSAHQVCTM